MEQYHRRYLQDLQSERWLEGDLYACRGDKGYHVHVAARAVNDAVKAEYVEESAQALLARILWLGAKGCDYPWEALRHLCDHVIAEMEELENA